MWINLPLIQRGEETEEQNKDCKRKKRRRKKGKVTILKGYYPIASGHQRPHRGGVWRGSLPDNCFLRNDDLSRVSWPLDFRSFLVLSDRCDGRYISIIMGATEGSILHLNNSTGCITRGNTGLNSFQRWFFFIETKLGRYAPSGQYSMHPIRSS